MSQASSMPDLKSLSRNDQIFLGAALLTLIFSFIAFAHLTFSAGSGFGSVSDTISAWHGIGTLAGLLVLVTVVVGAIAVFAPAVLESLPVSGRLIALATSALSLLFFLIRWLTLPSAGFGTFHAGYSLYWGGYVTLVLNIVTIVFAFLLLKATGESMPWENRSAATPPPPPAAPPAA